jgi:hypothetical protein
LIGEVAQEDCSLDDKFRLGGFDVEGDNCDLTELNNR